MCRCFPWQILPALCAVPLTGGALATAVLTEASSAWAWAFGGLSVLLCALSLMLACALPPCVHKRPHGTERRFPWIGYEDHELDLGERTAGACVARPVDRFRLRVYYPAAEPGLRCQLPCRSCRGWCCCRRCRGGRESYLQPSDWRALARTLGIPAPALSHLRWMTVGASEGAALHPAARRC
jgi:hypothetical protein